MFIYRMDGNDDGSAFAQSADCFLYAASHLGYWDLAVEILISDPVCGMIISAILVIHDSPL